jgi:hypothetical protein
VHLLVRITRSAIDNMFNRLRFIGHVVSMGRFNNQLTCGEIYDDVTPGSLRIVTTGIFHAGLRLTPFQCVTQWVGLRHA